MAKVKVPKKIAGVKVPKKLRKEAKQALRLADSQAVRDLAVAGLTLAAERMIGRSQRGASQSIETAADMNLKALHLGDVLRAAAMEGARQFLAGFEEPQTPAAKTKRAAKAAPKRAAASKPAAKAAPSKAAPKAAVASRGRKSSGRGAAAGQ